MKMWRPCRWWQYRKAMERRRERHRLCYLSAEVQIQRKILHELEELNSKMAGVHDGNL